jgi:nitroreductase
LTTIDTELHRKPADAHYPIHTLISERWSPRAFADRLVEEEKLYSVLEAARWAASAGNQQPWYFIVATKEHPEDHARLVKTINERNSVWAPNAPVLILVVAKLYPQPGREQTSFYDAGMAASNLVTQAVELGLVTHQMAGFSEELAHTLLGVPEGYQPLAMMALGYPGVADSLPPHLLEREKAPRSRKTVKEFVFNGQWDQSL